MSAIDQLLAHQSAVNKAFQETRYWYENRLEEVKSATLHALLTQALSELKKAQNCVNQYYEDVKKSFWSFEESKSASGGRLKNLQQRLADLVNKYPQTDSKAAKLANYAGTKSMLEALIQVEKGLLNTFEEQSKKTVDHIQSPDPKNVAANANASSALKLDYITAERVANVTKIAITAVVESIPGMSIINAADDIEKEFDGPVQNINEADSFLAWLEERIEKLKTLQHNWNFPFNF